MNNNDIQRKALNITDMAHTFENWKHDNNNDLVYKAFQDMIKPDVLPLLLCYGGVGNGKTFLCEALVIELGRTGVSARVITWGEFIREMKRKMFRALPGEVPYDVVFQNVRTAPYIIIDDIGMGTQGTEWEYGELEDIVSYRYKERLFTVMTTNKNLDQLPERIISRFSDPSVGRVVLNKGSDYRRKPK